MDYIQAARLTRKMASCYYQGKIIGNKMCTLFAGVADTRAGIKIDEEFERQTFNILEMAVTSSGRFSESGFKYSIPIIPKYYDILQQAGKLQAKLDRLHRMFRIAHLQYNRLIEDITDDDKRKYFWKLKDEIYNGY